KDDDEQRDQGREERADRDEVEVECVHAPRHRRGLLGEQGKSGAHHRRSALRKGPAPCGRTGERLGRLRPRSPAWSLASRSAPAALASSLRLLGRLLAPRPGPPSSPPARGPGRGARTGGTSFRRSRRHITIRKVERIRTAATPPNRTIERIEALYR